MNENDGGTPNPLSQNPLDANPSEPMEEINEVEISDVEVSETNEIPVRQVSSESDSEKPAIKENQPLTEELVEESVMVESLDPDGRPMEKLEKKPAAPKEKKKTGLIVGIIICLFVAVGCGVAAALMIMNSNNDPVATAMKKAVRGELPANVMVDGDIELTPIEQGDSAISRINIDLGVQAQTSSKVNAAEATVALTLINGDELSFSFNEIYSTNGDLYFKVDGISEFITELTLLQMPTDPMIIYDETCSEAMTENCAVKEEPGAVIEEYIVEEPTLDIFSMFGGLLGVVDGQWIRLSMDGLEGISSELVMDERAQCVMNLMNALSASSNRIADIYDKNPFISSTTNDIQINSKSNRVRQIVINEKAFANFTNATRDLDGVKDFYTCLGIDVEDDATVTADDIAKELEEVPAIYVEVDKDNNFSRLYVETTDEDKTTNMKIDLSFTYPGTINVAEPTEYTTFEELFQMMFMGMYGGELNPGVIETPVEPEPLMPLY